MARRPVLQLRRVLYTDQRTTQKSSFKSTVSMIDLLTIFTTGGVVVWQKELKKVPSLVLNSLVSEVFVENVAKGSTYHNSNYTVKYSVSNDLGLVFVTVYQSILQLSYADELLANIQKIFISLFSDEVKAVKETGDVLTSDDLDFHKFNAFVDVRLNELDEAAGGEIKEVNGKDNDDEEEEEEGGVQTPEPVSAPPTPQLGEDDAPLTPKGVKKTRRGAGKKKDTNSGTSTPKKAASKKQKRQWGEDGVALDVSGVENLDFSSAKAQEAGAKQSNFNAEEEATAAQGWGKSNKTGEFVLKELSSELDDILNEDSNDAALSSSSAAGQKSSFGFLRNFIGGKTLGPDDLKKASIAMREHLIKKNVAVEVADHLCETVDKSLLGSKTQSWTSVEATVRASMTEALRRILTPKTSLDLLHNVQSKRKSSDRPYVISVVGVNGVGKSTNLSKLAFWLLQNKFKVLIAACDTFRSGAVEQLKVHVTRLQELTERLGSGEVDIFTEGYGKDAAVIAQKAIEYGARNGFDVVLIDTAGRRHNDERLMSSLEKFGKLANPDKIIMVGEALVGTDSVQQARNFNAAFGSSRNLDFFLISKCDTVGDMIGTMVNMTYSTKIPVLFVGIGQNYTDLRSLSVEWAVNLLMK